jgi:hypothetical protein
MKTLDTQFGREVDKNVGGLVKGSIIKGIRLAAGTCSLLYRTGTVLVNGATEIAKFGVDAYQAEKDAKEYDRLVDAAKRASQDAGMIITPTMFLTELKRREIKKAYEDCQGTDVNLEDIDLDAYLSPSTA